MFFWLTIVSGTILVNAQDATYPPQKPSPPAIASQIVALPVSVVENQSTHTLKLVNAPQSVTRLNPGQCIRIGVYSTGDKRDEYLEKTKLSFGIEFAGHRDVHPFALLSQYKQIKPEGGDFVTAALGAAGIKPPERIRTMASLGISAETWCAPSPVSADGIATVSGDVESPGGHQGLSPLNIQIESFETGVGKPFKTVEELDAFSRTYYQRPNPARLVPALQFLVSEQTQHPREGLVEILTAFFCAALKADPIAARDFQTRIAAQPPMTRALGLIVLRAAGYDISSVVNSLDAEDRQNLLSLPPLQDPYDLTPNQDLFQHLDMLWAVFQATGEFRPVNTVASALSWRADYEEFAKLRKSPNHPSTLTPSIVRGVVYTAAGWSLGSFQRNDPLVADYIEYMLASPDTPQSVKLELGGLSNNPAFKRPGGQ